MTSYYAPTAIDLSRVPAPDAIVRYTNEELLAQFIGRFLTFWDQARAVNPALPAFDADSLEVESTNVVAQAFAWCRGHDRQNVIDTFRSLLAPLARANDLDVLAASRNIARLTVIPATANTAAVMESDTNLLRRYLLSFDRAAAGSRDRYLYEAWTAWPAMLDARVNGHAVHGRRGDTDIVIIGPLGRLPTEEERQLVRAAVTAPHVKPEAVAVSVLPATRLEYSVEMVIEVPPGPDPSLIVAEAVSRVRKAGDERMLIGGEVPAGLLSGAAYGPSVIKVRDLAPVAIAPDPYTVPVLTDINIIPEVRS